jgi:hypothetical protein
MPNQIAGRTVRVITQKLGQGIFSPAHYWVAESDPDKAEGIIRQALGTTPDETVEAVGTLSPGEIEGLGLEPGKYMPGA